MQDLEAFVAAELAKRAKEQQDRLLKAMLNKEPYITLPKQEITLEVVRERLIKDLGDGQALIEVERLK